MVQLRRTVEKSLLSNFNKKLSSNTPKPPPEPEDVTALPVANSDDDSAGEDYQAQYGDSSDDGGLSNGADLVRSDLRAKTISKTPAATNGRQGSTKANSSSPKTAGVTQQRRSPRQGGVTNPKKRWKDEIEDDEEGESDAFAPNKKTKTNSDCSRVHGAHMKNGWLVEREMVKAKGPTRITYGGKRGGQSQTSTPQEQFISVGRMSDSVSPERPKFKTRPSQLHDTSPIPEHKPSRLAKSEDSDISPLTELDSEALSDPPRPLNGRTKQQRPDRRQSSKFKRQVRDVTPEPVSQRPEFKMPDGYNDYTPNAGLVDLDLSLNKSQTESKKANLGLGKALCPMCEEQVDEEWLKDFSKGQRMTIARQARFCRTHKRRTAQKTWEEKSYPNISWGNLETRIKGHHDYIESLIRGKTSHFGAKHQENIKTGQNRTLLKTEDYLTPGYYGLRGMSLMTEAIVDTFSSLLRERAPRDKLISARGYTGFVQSVLVPELAVKLIQEDMSLSADEAREVMRDSRGVGEILNDERRESQKQAQAVKDESGTEEHGAAEDDSAQKGYPSDDEVPVKLKIQEVADSESELSSIASMGAKEAESKFLVRTHPQGIDDSDSDLSSVGAW